MSKVKISLFELRAQSFQLAYNVKYDFSLSKTLIRLTQEYKINKPLSFQYRVFSLTGPAYMQIYWNKRKWSHKKKNSTPRGLVWDTNMASVSLFWDSDMATVTSCENSLYHEVYFLDQATCHVTIIIS